MGHQQKASQLTKTMKILLAIFAFMAASDGLVITGKPMQPRPEEKSCSKETPLPKEMTLTLTMPEKVVNLNLKKNPNIPSNFSVIVAHKGTFSNWTQNPSQFAVYSDAKHHSSVVVRTARKNNTFVKYYSGSLQVDGVHYSLNPRDDKLRDRQATVGIGVKINGAEHIMRIENPTLDYDDILPRKVVPQVKEFNRPRANAGPSGFQRYVVELCVFIDYALYQRWYKRSNASDHQGKNSDAINNLKYYFVQVANGVDMRYSSIKQSDYSINVRLVGIVIASDQNDSPWAEATGFRVVHGQYTYVDMKKVLDSFDEWLPKQMSRIGFVFDQATVFTGYRLYDGHYCNNEPCEKNGLANVGTICVLSAPTAYSTAISNEIGLYASINTWAHEIGHNLGAYHDGIGNTCKSADQYVMAASPGELTSSNFNNPFTFSSCSMDSFRDTLAKITRTHRENCLLVMSSAPTKVAPPDFPQFPGMQYSADQQCQNIFGSASYYCGGGSRDQTICRAMECWLPGKSKCFVEIEQRAADGTKCGNRKWCMKGQCVFDSRADPTPDTCIYGDYKDLVDVGSRNWMSCSDMGRLHPYRCYDNHTNADCCQTCAAIRDL